MTDTAFDTLRASRVLKAAGMEAEHADAIVNVMGQPLNKLVTTERFDAGLAAQQVQIEAISSGLSTRIDSLRIEMRAEIVRSHLISVVITISANALMMAILGIVLTRGPGT